MEGMEILLGRASITQSFCHAIGNIQYTLISQISITCVSIKFET